MNRAFQSEGFRKLFQDLVVFQESALANGGKKVIGKSSLIQVELEEDNEGLRNARLLFPFFLKDPESNRKITTHIFHFLDLCLPSTITPPDWMQAATKKLKNTDEKAYVTEHEGIMIALLQMKPDLMFVLSAERQSAAGS